MLLAFMVFLFVLYCILEGFKYNRPEYEEAVTKFSKKPKYKEIKTLNEKIVYLKSFVFFLFFVLLIIHHFIDPLSKSTGLKGLAALVLVSLIIWFICIRDIIVIRRAKNEKV